MACLYLASRLAITLPVARHWRVRGRPWLPRHTLFSIVIPVTVFFLWTCFWWLFPADVLPESWFDGLPTPAESAFMCVPPLLFSWSSFFLTVGKSKQSRQRLFNF